MAVHLYSDLRANLIRSLCSRQSCGDRIPSTEAAAACTWSQEGAAFQSSTGLSAGHKGEVKNKAPTFQPEQEVGFIRAMWSTGCAVQESVSQSWSWICSSSPQ